MERHEIEALLKSCAKTFNPIENNFSNVDGIDVDYSFTYHGNILTTFKRILSPKNSFVISSEMTRETILSVLDELKQEEIYDNFCLEEESRFVYNVLIDGKKCSIINIFYDNMYGIFYFKENYLSNKKPNKVILAQKLLETLDIDEIHYVSNNLFRENYYLEYINQESLFSQSLLNKDIFFDKTFFTFRKANF